MRLSILLLATLLGALTVSAAPSPAWKQDRFWVTFWCPPPANDDALAAVARDGYNLTWTPEAGLDAAQKHGLRAMLQDPRLDPAALDDPARREELTALIKRVRQHPALEAYYLTDEPSAAAFPALGRLVAFLRELDPAHVAFINLFPTYANNTQLGTTGDTVTAYQAHLDRYMQEVRPSLVSYDHYHFFKDRDGDQYFLNLGMIREAAAHAGVPFLNIIQACTIEKSWRLVNAEELRFLVYTTLAYGGRGICYFLHWGPKAYGGLYQDGVRTPLADTVAGLNRELALLGPVLMEWHSVGVHHTAPLPRGGTALPPTAPLQLDAGADCVVGLFATAPEAPVSTALVANRSHSHATQVTVRWSPQIRRLEELDRTTGRWSRVAEWKQEAPLSVTLAPGDGRCFRFR